NELKWRWRHRCRGDSNWISRHRSISSHRQVHAHSKGDFRIFVRITGWEFGVRYVGGPASASSFFLDGRNSKPFAMRTVEVRSAPSRSSHFSFCKRPLNASALPFFAYCAMTSASRPNTTILNQSATDSRVSPTFILRLLATERLTTGVPPLV